MSSPKNFRNGLLTKNIFRGTCRGLGTAFATLASLDLSKLWRESRCNLQVIRPCVLEPPPARFESIDACKFLGSRDTCVSDRDFLKRRQQLGMERQISLRITCSMLFCFFLVILTNISRFRISLPPPPHTHTFPHTCRIYFG